MPTAVTPTFPIEFIPIPESNYRKGRNGMVPDAIAIHIADGSKLAVVSTFKNPANEKSSHFLVNKDGSITQFVNTANASYCNGILDNPINELVLKRTQNPNDWTITIEHEGFGSNDITQAQYAATAMLIKFLSKKWNIPLDRTHVFGHREVFSRKTCPGLINIDKLVQTARLLK